MTWATDDDGAKFCVAHGYGYMLKAYYMDDDSVQCLACDVASDSALALMAEKAFEAARKTVETSQQEGGYSFNHHTHYKHKTFDDYLKALERKKK